MKKLLKLFSSFVLVSGSSLAVASCTAQPKHDREVDDDLDVNQDLDILNQIKNEVNQALNAWWQTKTTIDINDYPDQLSFFTELVDKLKKENDKKDRTPFSEY